MNRFQDKTLWSFVDLQKVLSQFRYCAEVKDRIPVIRGCICERTIIFRNKKI